MIATRNHGSVVVGFYVTVRCHEPSIIGPQGVVGEPKFSEVLIFNVFVFGVSPSFRGFLSGFLWCFTILGEFRFSPLLKQELSELVESFCILELVSVALGMFQWSILAAELFNANRKPP